MLYHNSVLGNEVTLICLGRRARLFLRAMAPSPSRKNSGLANPRWRDVYRLLEKSFDRQLKMMKSHFDEMVKMMKSHFDEMVKGTRETNQRLSSLEHDARQPRLAMKADGQADIKTRERTEGAATAVQAMHGDSCSANRVDPDPMCSTSFGDDCTGPCSRQDALAGNGAAAPKSFLPSLEMRIPSPYFPPILCNNRDHLK